MKVETVTNSKITRYCNLKKAWLFKHRELIGLTNTNAPKNEIDSIKSIITRLTQAMNKLFNSMSSEEKIKIIDICG